MEDEIVKLDGFDSAIVGRCRSAGIPDVLIYDVEKCIDVLVSRDGMSRQDAVDFFDYNIFNAYYGPGTPIFMTVYEDDD